MSLQELQLKVKLSKAEAAKVELEFKILKIEEDLENKIRKCKEEIQRMKDHIGLQEDIIESTRVELNKLS